MQTDITVVECADCGHLTTSPVIRCGRCQSLNLRTARRSGVGRIAAATTTDSASFAIVDLERDLQLLAIGEPGLELRIGDRIGARDHGDGTFDLVSFADSGKPA